MGIKGSNKNNQNRRLSGFRNFDAETTFGMKAVGRVLGRWEHDVHGNLGEQCP